jgi:Na+-transporting NADH:ubiquinone oxidoreductase subunit NqrC
MTTFFILLGTLLCSIIITTVQIKLASKKEMDELNQLFDEVNCE